MKHLISKFANRSFDSDNYDSNCLQCAAQEGHLEVVQYLIEECGFDPGARNTVTIIYCMAYTLCITYSISIRFFPPDILDTLL